MTYDPIDTSATDNAADGSVTTDTLDSTTVNNSGTVTTQDIVVNGTATGPFGGGGVVLEAGDTITVETITLSSTDNSLVFLYSGPAKDVLGGIVGGHRETDFLYTFSDGSTLKKNGTGTVYSNGNQNMAKNSEGSDRIEYDILPPALDVAEIKVGGTDTVASELGAEVILKD